jgi:hypothetical protein
MTEEARKRAIESFRILEANPTNKANSVIMDHLDLYILKDLKSYC